jgi:hypothetical protein
VHYGVPDGSYATDPDGAARVFECRAMVAALNTEAGLRVVLDVVYNHTHGSGAHGRESVLDKVRARCSAEGEGEGALEEHGAGGSRVVRVGVKGFTSDAKVANRTSRVGHGATENGP